MWVAIAVGVMSLIPMMGGIRLAHEGGLSVLVVPIVALEAMFLASLYLLWRGLAGTEDGFQSPRREASPKPDRLMRRPRQRAGGRAAQRELGGVRSRIGRFADWWFNGLQEPRRH